LLSTLLTETAALVLFPQIRPTDHEATVHGHPEEEGTVLVPLGGEESPSVRTFLQCDACPYPYTVLCCQQCIPVVVVVAVSAVVVVRGIVTAGWLEFSKQLRLAATRRCARGC
jgi:hypothetical protein